MTRKPAFRRFQKTITTTTTKKQIKIILNTIFVKWSVEKWVRASLLSPSSTNTPWGGDCERGDYDQTSPLMWRSVRVFLSSSGLSFLHSPSFTRLLLGGLFCLIVCSPNSSQTRGGRAAANIYFCWKKKEEVKKWKCFTILNIADEIILAK